MEWETQVTQQLQHAQLPQTTVFGGVDEGDGVGGVGGDGGSLYVKVMTDEQLEILRTQIAVYSAICEQLVEMHKAVTAQQDLAGVRLGNPYCDPFVTSFGGHKITARQRWTPTPIQLQKLERLFDQGMGTPSKQKIKEITSELSQHGQISETNVYNWFQNRRARSKRKQQNNNNNNNNNGNGASSNNMVEDQVEADAESPTDKKTKPVDEDFQLGSGSGTTGEDTSNYLQSQCHQMMMTRPGIQSNKVEPVGFEDDGKLPCQSIGQQLSFMESMMETQRFDHLIGGKMDIPPSYTSIYHSGEDYSFTR